MYTLAVTVNAVITATLPITLQLLSSSSNTMFDRIETYEGDVEEAAEAQDYVDSAKGVATASRWIAIVGGKALMFLSGFQMGRGKTNLSNQEAKRVVGFQTGFSVLAFAMLFTLCGMGIKVYNSAETWNVKECAFPSSTSTSTSTSTTTTTDTDTDTDTKTAEEKAADAEKDATRIYNAYIACLVIFGVMFGIYLWFSVEFGEFSPNRPKRRASAGPSVTGGHQGASPSVSDFFTY
jgi:hypothetical protein